MNQYNNISQEETRRMGLQKEYYAFISYKRVDTKETKRLQHALEYYRLPNHLRQENPKYLRYVSREMADHAIRHR